MENSNVNENTSNVSAANCTQRSKTVSDNTRIEESSHHSMSLSIAMLENAHNENNQEATTNEQVVS